MKGWQSEAGRLIKGNRQGQSWSRSCSRCTCMHYHSFTVCRPPLFCHSLSLFLPPTFSFHPRPTFLVVVVVVGVAIRHGAQCEKHKAKLGQILHAAQITLEDCTLLSSPLCCSLILHLKLALCLCWGHLSPHVSPVRLLPLLNCTHTQTHARLLPWPIYFKIITVPIGQVACNFP